MTDKNVAANKRHLFAVFPIHSIFSVLSAILLLGNVTYTLAEDTKVLEVGPAEVLSTLSDLLKVWKATYCCFSGPNNNVSPLIPLFSRY